jgi:RNA polymerase-binding transcription factor DksA
VTRGAGSTKAAGKKPAVTSDTAGGTSNEATKQKIPAKKAAAKIVAKKAAANSPEPTKAAKSPNKAATKGPAKATANRSSAAAKPRKTFNLPTPSDPATRDIPAEAGYLRDQAWLAQQREALLAERAKYTSSADRLAAEAAALMADREPGDVQFDEESGEGDTIAVERDRDLALSAAARQAVADIDAALARLDSNTYGLCLAGDDVIPKERLEAIPEASVCVQHKTSMF